MTLNLDFLQRPLVSAYGATITWGLIAVLALAGWFLLKRRRLF